MRDLTRRVVHIGAGCIVATVLLLAAVAVVALVTDLLR